MCKQNYEHHAMFYAPHHFVFYPIITALIVVSGGYIFKYPENALLWSIITALLVLVFWLSFMLRQHYALGLQNRVVRLEMRLRYYQLTQKMFEPLEQQLSFGQLAALRFAANEELPGLIEEAIKNNLSPNAIKKSIKNWQPDTMRI